MNIATEPKLDVKGKIMKIQKQHIGVHMLPFEELKGMIATYQTVVSLLY